MGYYIGDIVDVYIYIRSDHAQLGTSSHVRQVTQEDCYQLPPTRSPPISPTLQLMNGHTQKMDANSEAIREQTTADAPPPVEVSMSVLVMAVCIQMLALYHQLPIPSLAYFPSATSAALCMMGTRMATNFGHTARCVWSIGMQCILMTCGMTCVAATSSHWFCIHRLVAPNSTASAYDTVCSKPGIDLVFFMSGLVCIAFVALALVGVTSLRKRN